MIKLLCLIAGSCYLGRYVEKHKQLSERNIDRVIYNISLILICVGFILFAGLRTRYNDTYNYIEEFGFGGTEIDWNPTRFFNIPYYGFDVYKRLIKRFFNYNAQWLFMMTAIISNIIYIRFYYNKSRTFALTLLWYIIIGPYILGCAAVKQIMAMSISLIGINYLLEKKYIRFYIFLIIAYFFHPYIILVAFAPLLLDDKVWSQKMINITLISMLCCLLFSRFIGIFLSITEGVGKGYTVEEMLDHTINPIRVIVDWIPVFISYRYRNEINKKADKTMVFGINMMIISAIFTFASLFGNPIYIYRTGQYFVSMNAIVVPWMLTECIPKNKWKKLIIQGLILFYMVIFIYDICGTNIMSDPFRHTSIMTLFRH